MLAASTCFASHAQTVPIADQPAAGTNLDFTFKPGVWLTRLNGETTLGPGGTTIVVEDSLNLNGQEAAFGAELAVVKDKTWRISMSGFYFSTDGEGAYSGDAQFGDLALSDGDFYSADFEMTSIAGEFGFWLYEPYTVGPQPNGRDSRLGLRVGAILGVRYVDVDQSISVSGEGSESAGGEWLAPFAGVQLEFTLDMPDHFPLVDSFVIDAAGVLGPALGGDGGTMTYFYAGLTAYFTHNIGIGLEYRLIHLDVENGEYQFAGGLQGLFFFASLRF